MSATGKIACLSSPVRLRQSGFTLFEMLVTLAILALITGVGYPRLQNLLARRTMAEARSAVALAVARARSEAVRRDLPVRVLLSDAGDALTISRIAATPLPAGTTVEWPRNGVAIFGDGSSSGAKGTLQAGAATSHFTIDPATAHLDFAP